MVTLLLHFPHGLGDTVQFSVVLKHLRKYRPDWEVSVRCGRGKHSALLGLCHAVYHDQEAEPSQHFDTSVPLGWYENYSRYEDRPNSKITNCLTEVFGIDYDPSLGRYEVHPTDDAKERARNYLRSTGAQETAPDKFQAVIIHYEGNTSTWKKNLKHWQGQALAQKALLLGRVPIVLDWDGRSPVPDDKTIFCPRPGKEDVWGGWGSGDAGVITAMIAMAEAYVGIDSGPGKCASATDTPTLIVWREHHPVQFHDPAPNTTHLLPHNWRTIPPAERLPIADFFLKHYQYVEYGGDFGLTDTATDWLARVLGGQMPILRPGKRIFVIPNGIGDALWVLHKIKGVAQDGPIDLILSGNPARELDHRAEPFLKRFPFIHSATLLDVPVLRSERDYERNDEKGRYRYWPDGERSGYHFLIPNAVLEKGERLETWLPEVPVDWSVVNDFSWDNTDKGDLLGRSLGDFVAFYLGPEEGNVDEGHGRGFIWEPKQWLELGQLFQERGLRIALVGAAYDRSYYDRYVKEAVKNAGWRWFDFLGQLEIGETMALLKRARLFVSYQCGLGIFAHYLGLKVCMWWRPDGDSIHGKRLISFDERMATAWTNPAYADRYLGLIYKRCSPSSIVAQMHERGWLDKIAPSS